MHTVDVIQDPGTAVAALHPTKARILSEMSQPISAAGLAERVGLTRQKVNYHLRGLEEHGLVHVADERKWGGLTERLMVATASSYVVSPAALGPVASDPKREGDRLSARYLVALAARVIREIAALLRLSADTGKRFATLSIDAEIRFRSAADRAAFTDELTQAVASLVSRYHDETHPGGRPHRLVAMAHPIPQEQKHESTH